MKLRYARATNQLGKISEMYVRGLGLKTLGSFENHQGFDGIILGHEERDYHFEFTQEIGVTAPRANSPENLVVFYIPHEREWTSTSEQMIKAGFNLVPAHNPYWDENGATFEDPEGYRVVLSKEDWS